MSVFVFRASATRWARAALATAGVLLAGACSSPMASSPAAHGTDAPGAAAHATEAASTSASALPTVGPSALTLPDLPYAALDPAEQLDLYLPAAGAHPAPLLIWIHGTRAMKTRRSCVPSGSRRSRSSTASSTCDPAATRGRLAIDVRREAPHIGGTGGRPPGRCH